MNDNLEKVIVFLEEDPLQCVTAIGDRAKRGSVGDNTGFQDHVGFLDSLLVFHLDVLELEAHIRILLFHSGGTSFGVANVVVS